jgi:alginate O-acetyltransferase complex protein AlgI
MLFNSINFFIFLPIVFVLYWFVFKKSFRLQNVLLLVASYFFYACWDWRFLFLLVFSTVLDFFTGLQMENAPNKKSKKFWFWLSICINLGFLFFFKYYNFFIGSFTEALAKLNLHINPWTLKIILPVGISFYTFHGLSYVIDIYQNKIKAEKNFVNYSVFVSFFPLLVAGPIERATHLLPQIKNKRTFEYTKAVEGLRQILWGLFKKIVIADQCAVYVNYIFNDAANQSGSNLVVGSVLFAFQIYGDFSGYSDIALGVAKLFGIDLLRNFAFPYFSRDIAEFWRRWHISLSSWFRDYLYIPLGGSKGGLGKKIRNTFIIFLVSGFWHGANWTFIVWGLLNALYIMPSIVLNTHRNNLDIVAKGKIFPNVKDFFSILITFGLTCFAWIFFRANNLDHAMLIVGKIFSSSLLHLPSLTPQFQISTKLLYILIFLFILVEWWGRQEQFAIAKLCYNKPQWIRWACYIMLVSVIIYMVGEEEQQFIYFQF